jgi:uncharacterized phage protein (TIGR01671 family)
MREIKFRAWNIAEKEMYPSVGFRDTDCGRFIIREQFMMGVKTEIEMSSNIVLMQYTGIKDKNGIEIYEGDVVTTYGNTDKQKYEIKYLGTGYHLQSLSLKDNCSLMQANERLEIIDNIHENPELLEKEV